jgi:peptide/nickel transport system permease protein
MPIGYLVTRIAQLIPVVFIAVTINFMIPRLILGDPIEAALQTRIPMTGSIDANVAEIAAIYRAKFGLDKPIWQ